MSTASTLVLLAWALPAADVGLYFGSGCFWHVQHELVAAEREILGRSDAGLTALVGYAGGETPAAGGRVCYHSDPANDYSDAGHTEVVYVSVPRNKVRAFAARYWRLFTGNGGTDRKDVQDVGAQYRAAVGVPGLDGAIIEDIRAAQTTTLELRNGSGSDGDSLGQGLVWVYDASQKPFFQGELYHQFHSDMMETYSVAYGDLKAAFVSAGKLRPTGCAQDGDPASATQQTLPPATSGAAARALELSGSRQRLRAAASAAIPPGRAASAPPGDSQDQPRLFSLKISHPHAP